MGEPEEARAATNSGVPSNAHQTTKGKRHVCGAIQHHNEAPAVGGTFWRSSVESKTHDKDIVSSDRYSCGAVVVGGSATNNNCHEIDFNRTSRVKDMGTKSI